MMILTCKYIPHDHIYTPTHSISANMIIWYDNIHTHISYVICRYGQLGYDDNVGVDIWNRVPTRIGILICMYVY